MAHTQQTSRYVENFIFNIIIEQTYIGEMLTWALSNLPILQSSHTILTYSYLIYIRTVHHIIPIPYDQKCSEAVCCATAEPARRHCAIFAFRNFAATLHKSKQQNNKTTDPQHTYICRNSERFSNSNLYFIQMIVWRHEMELVLACRAVWCGSYMRKIS